MPLADGSSPNAMPGLTAAQGLLGGRSSSGCMECDGLLEGLCRAFLIRFPVADGSFRENGFGPGVQGLGCNLLKDEWGWDSSF